jgi:hypothetical protein
VLIQPKEGETFVYICKWVMIIKQNEEEFDIQHLMSKKERTDVKIINK